MHTKVILMQDIPNLGEEGDIKVVARGYARNYLFPKKLVVPHNKGNLAVLEARRAAIEKHKEEKRRHAQGVKERIESTPLTIIMPMGDKGRLFGSVTSTNIVDELQKMGILVERKKVEVPESSIKSQGNYKVKIRLYDNQEAILSVAVNPQAAEEKSKEEPSPETGA